MGDATPKQGGLRRKAKPLAHTCMKLRQIFCLSLVALAFAPSARLVAGDSKSVVVGIPPREQTIRPGSLVEVPSFGISSRLELPADLKALVEQFRAQAEAFVTAQKELARQLKGSTVEQKEQLKEQLKTNREKFLEDTAQLRADIRERVKELKTTLQESRPVDAGAGEGRKRGRRGGN